MEFSGSRCEVWTRCLGRGLPKHAPVSEPGVFNGAGSREGGTSLRGTLPSSRPSERPVAGPVVLPWISFLHGGCLVNRWPLKDLWNSRCSESSRVAFQNSGAPFAREAASTEQHLFTALVAELCSSGRPPVRSLELPQPLLDQSLTSPTSGLLPQGPTSYGPLQGLLPQVSEPLVWHPLGPYPGEVRRSPVLRLSGRWVGSRKWDLKDILPGVQRIFTGLVHRDWDKVLFRRLIGNPVCVCVCVLCLRTEMHPQVSSFLRVGLRPV